MGPHVEVCLTSFWPETQLSILQISTALCGTW